MRETTSTICVAIVPTLGANYRKIARENWNLSDAQMAGMHVHHRIPRSSGGTNDPSNLYVCSPWYHSNVWHSDTGGFIGIAQATGRKGGKSRSPTKLDHIQSIADSRRGTKLPQWWCDNLKKSAKGTSTPEHAALISRAMKGRKKSPKHCAAISKAMKGKKTARSTCPHCGLTGGVIPMKRYHFNNCKHKEQ